MTHEVVDVLRDSVDIPEFQGESLLQMAIANEGNIFFTSSRVMAAKSICVISIKNSYSLLLSLLYTPPILLWYMPT